MLKLPANFVYLGCSTHDCGNSLAIIMGRERKMIPSFQTFGHDTDIQLDAHTPTYCTLLD